ncbi:DUF1642 domain-containing protein, partial [Enterococcus gilvus]|uniref:DUF1642 domain-containing protein n=1 Tax=Enterococcus gilvus TaxID=160453 RepID=UPI003D6A305A
VFMNKQEWIEKIKANGEWFETNRYVKITKVIELVNQIDEPQKVKVPAFVADWIEEVKQRGCGLADALDCFASPIMPDIIKEWLEFNSSVIGCHHDHQELLARAWLDDYEVEEEPKYYLKLPKMGMVNEISNSQLCWTNCDGGITEKEIKAIDERYWPFAVPVEKV